MDALMENYLKKGRKYKMKQSRTINIPGGKLTGYLWRSNNKPYEVAVYDGSKVVPEIKLDASENPFVVEGQLYDDEKNKSYSIKYVDGLYWLKVYDRGKLDAEIDKDDIQEYWYIASFDKAPGRLCFKEYWRTISNMEDPNKCFKECNSEKEADQCLDFKPLCPAEFVFVGFEK